MSVNYASECSQIFFLLIVIEFQIVVASFLRGWKPKICYTKIGKERETFTEKNEEISRWKSRLNTWKLNWNFLMITDVFVYQKRVNVCEHMASSLPCVHIHLLSSDQERHLCSSKYFSWASMCLSPFFIWRSLHFFSKRLFSPPFLCYPYFSTFLSTWSHNILYLTKARKILHLWWWCGIFHTCVFILNPTKEVGAQDL